MLLFLSIPEPNEEFKNHISKNISFFLKKDYKNFSIICSPVLYFLLHAYLWHIALELTRCLYTALPALAQLAALTSTSPSDWSLLQKPSCVCWHCTKKGRHSWYNIDWAQTSKTLDLRLLNNKIISTLITDIGAFGRLSYKTQKE